MYHDEEFGDEDYYITNVRDGEPEDEDGRTRSGWLWFLDDGNKELGAKWECKISYIKRGDRLWQDIHT